MLAIKPPTPQSVLICNERAERAVQAERQSKRVDGRDRPTASLSRASERVVTIRWRLSCSTWNPSIWCVTRLFTVRMLMCLFRAKVRVSRARNSARDQPQGPKESMCVLRGW